jgi:hypothetical protein
MEIWKPVPFNPLYEVSSHGNFRNAKTLRQTLFHIDKLKAKQTRIRVSVKNDIKKGTGFYLHRLIAMTFIPNPDNLEEVNHIDGDPYNNRVENLEWITREDNMRHFHENREKYDFKTVRQVALYCSKTDAVLEAYKCIDDCILNLGLDVSYSCLYAALNPSTNKNNSSNSNNSNKYGTNKYVGVTFNKINKKYIATYKNKYIGSFTDELEAAKSYDNHLRGLGLKNMNFPVSGEVQAIVGKKKHHENNNTNSCIYLLKDRDQYLKYETDNNNNNNCKTIINDDIEWREIKDAPKYSVSNTGLVKHTRLDRLLKGYNRNGYVQVTIKTDDGGQLARLVHRLVAMAFIENDDPDVKIYVDHLDTDPKNNHVSNLRWVTPKENMNNETTRENISKAHMQKSPRVYQIDIETGDIIMVAENSNEITKMGVNIAVAQKIANFYKKVVENNFAKVSVEVGQQKTYNNKWIFLYETELEKRMQIIEECINKMNSKKIVQMDKKTGEIIASYNSMYEASKTLNFNYSAINQVCNYYKYDDALRPACYKLKSTGGYIFQYAL